MSFAFRPITRDDVPLLRDWIGRPHLQEWWGHVEEEINMFFTAGVAPYIFSKNKEDIGIIQYWDVASTRNHPDLTPLERKYLAVLRDEDLGIDISIGDSDNLDRGLGSAAISSFIHDIVPKTNGDIIIDPDSRNLRAIRAYEKAGFHKIGTFYEREDSITLLKYERAHD